MDVRACLHLRVEIVNGVIKLKNTTGQHTRFLTKSRCSHHVAQSSILCNVCYAISREGRIKRNKSSTCFEHAQQGNIGIK